MATTRARSAAAPSDTVAPPQPAAAGDACPTCAAPIDKGQEYCLECGARIASAPAQLIALRRAWENRLGRYPGDWIWSSLLALVVAAGASAAAVVLTTDSASGGPETIVATSPVVTAPPPPSPKAKPRKPAPATSRSARPTRPARPRPKPTLSQWPARNGYTVVISSIPARPSGLTEARRKAQSVLDAGLSPAGVLRSSSFSSLHPGYYVVFAGVYASLEEAQAAVPAVSKRFPNAYARQISR